MISVSEAKSIITESVSPMAPVQWSLLRAIGLTLAADVFAKTDIPAFPQSSMDGYTFAYHGWKLYNELFIEGEMAAGDAKAVEMRADKAIRIFTGAAVPPGADTVVMQEKIRTEDSKLIIEDDKLRQGSNTRPQGSEIKAGELALPTGTHLSPAAIGFLAGIGINEVSVFPSPSISIIVTGNELQQPGQRLEYGQVYESNSFTLTAALERMHIRDVSVQRVQDDAHALTRSLREALESADVVLLIGGISVGDYDFVLKAATDCSVVPLFHKIKQRPGKPLYYGRKDKKLVFGLPGNPSSALVCFYLYVQPALEQLINCGSGERTHHAPLGKTYHKEAGLTHFLKGYYDGQAATPLDAQESYRLRSFARSNCLIQIDEEVIDCIEGTVVEIHLLPM